MSDNWLQYVPKVPTFRPTQEASAKAQSLLSVLLPDAESVESTFQEEVVFFHPGGNWSGVQCPVCGADAEPWWSGAMENAAKSGFSSLQCVAPCCGSSVSLAGLRYVWPAGFGSYVLEAMNPNSRGLSADQLAQLEAVLGCQLHEIPLHI
ncbi:MAG: hypothetical protein EPO06_08910 [Burkholderiaceae bacterium]|nr:MAG: hypothetical protein EPO06_08910 [Burkholderiaceae bacterium]